MADKVRVSVDFIEGTEDDFDMAFADRSAAMSEIDRIVSRGYVIRDRSKDRTNITTAVIPLGRVKAIYIREISEPAPPPKPVRR